MQSQTRIQRAAAPLLFWLFGILNLFHPLLFSYNPGDIGDTRLVLYFLEHQFKVATDPHYPGHFATAPFWYPESANDMARSEMLTGALPFYLLPRLILPRDAAYDAFLIIVATLNFFALYWLLGSLEVRAPVAALAAFVFAFGMHKIQHTVHVQFFLQCWGVLSLFLLVRFLRQPTRMLVFWTVLLLGLQALASAYSGMFYFLGAVLLVTFYTAIAPRVVWKTLLWCRGEFFAIVGAAAVATAPIALLLLPYLRTPAVRRPWEEILLFVPTFSSWLDPLQGTLWWFFKRFLGLRVEPHETYFLGAVFLLLAVWAWLAFWLRPSWRADVRLQVGLAFLAMSASLVLLTAQIEGHTPWILVYRFLPGASGIRDIRRISVVVNAGLLIGGALFLDLLLSRWSKSAARFLLSACVAGAVAENCLLLALVPPTRWMPYGYTYPHDWYAAQSAELAGLMRGASAAYVYPDPSMVDFAHEINTELVSQQVDVPVMNGYSGVVKPGYELKMPPRKALGKGTEFDFEHFVYIVPRSEEPSLRGQLDQAGLSFLKGGRYFALYAPYGPDRGFDVDFQIIGPPPARLQRGQIAGVPVVFTNRSRFPWQSLGDEPTFPAYQVLSPDTGKLLFEGMRTAETSVVFPGESALVPLQLKIDVPGAYIVRLAMVQEKVAWFGPKDPKRYVQFPVTVQ